MLLIYKDKTSIGEKKNPFVVTTNNLILNVTLACCYCNIVVRIEYNYIAYRNVG